VAPLEGSAGGQASLADRLRAGDPAASRELVVRFQRGVAVILRRCGVQAAEIEDLGQEVFRIVLDKARQGEVREPERLPGYVATVARNLGIEAGRRASARAARDGGDLLPEVASGAASPLDELVAREQVALVRRLLEELGTDRDREVLMRIYLAGDEREVVARDLGLSALQLNRVLHRARERYRELYEQALRAVPTGGRP
jgi:RNA polymerase sigma-70 factor (ECF subfamily)